MKSFGKMLWVLTAIMIISCVICAISANNYYHEYQSYRSYNAVDKIYGDVCRAAAVIEAIGAVLVAFAAYAVTDANRYVENTEEQMFQMLKKLETIEKKQKSNYDDIVSFIQQSTKTTAENIQKIAFVDAVSENKAVEQPKQAEPFAEQTSSVTYSPKARRSRTGRPLRDYQEDKIKEEKTKNFVDSVITNVL